jgi:hypothetical protein
MRRQSARAFKRGWVAFYILGICGFGVVAAGWSGPPRMGGLTAAQAVALRFPEDWDDDPAPDATLKPGIVGAAQLALFSPHPMSPQTAERPAATPPAAPEGIASAPAPEQVNPAPAARAPVARVTPVHAKPAAAPVHKAANRPGFVLNDTQIASIKRRLNLTPDQEHMWPAVEAALRSIAYAKAHDEAHRRSVPTAGTQVANVDPNSPEVQGLKSAAFPLILSFNSEQKSEVRTLAHVMGLDQLASQF